VPHARRRDQTPLDHYSADVGWSGRDVAASWPMKCDRRFVTPTSDAGSACHIAGGAWGVVAETPDSLFNRAGHEGRYDLMTTRLAHLNGRCWHLACESTLVVVRGRRWLENLLQVGGRAQSSSVSRVERAGSSG